ncbi:MAG: DUF4303 domain-containing protein [Planctomycetaceae bacterium]|nr:DUF4303 domain-containing protein [Planctomycetaceae bacterium]
MTDFSAVKELLKQGIIETLDGLRKDHPNETFYAFALYDADGDAIDSSANSEEKFQKQIERAGCANSDERFLYRWGTAEWAYEATDHTEKFGEANALLSEADRDDWYEFQAKSFGASIFALKELADVGLFGTGKNRMVAFFSLSDDEYAPWLEIESARRINPPDVFQTFESEWKICTQQTWGEDIDLTGGELAQAFQKVHGTAW